MTTPSVAIHQAAEDFKSAVEAQVKYFNEKTGLQITGLDIQFSVMEVTHVREGKPRTTVDSKLLRIDIEHTGSKL